MGDSEYTLEVERILAARLSRLRQLSYSAIQALPQSSAENVDILGANAILMVSRQDNPETLQAGVMVVVTVARATLGGIASRHWEKAWFSQAYRNRERQPMLNCETMVVSFMCLTIGSRATAKVLLTFVPSHWSAAPEPKR